MADATTLTTGEQALAALAAKLGSYGLTVHLNGRGLRVTNSAVRGCCQEAAHAADTVTCRPRDNGPMWFFTSWGEPIGAASRVADAARIVRAALTDRATT